MAISGLHNVSILDSSFLVESESQKRPNTRAASVLQMWRDLEGENVVSHPKRVSEASDIDRVSTPGSLIAESENEQEDNHSVCSEQSIDIGEVERERVRNIFSEWMKSGVKSHHNPRNVLQMNNRSKAENEIGRVRITRDEGVAPEIVERKAIPIRKLCGRQALLDMVMRDQRERKKELQDLLMRRPVADFAHRTRIQSLLKGRFLLNQRVVHDERPASTAASELGLLSRKHTVSHLREGFLSKLDCSSGNGVQISPGDCINEPSQSSNEQEEVRDEIYNQVEPEPEPEPELHTDNAQREMNENDIITEQELSDNLVIESQVSRVEEEEEEEKEEEEKEEEEEEEKENERLSIELISSEHNGENDSPGSWRNNVEEWSTQTSSDDIEMYNENDAQSNVDDDDAETDDSHVYGFEDSMTEASELEHDEEQGIGDEEESSVNNVWEQNDLQEESIHNHSVGRFGSLHFPDDENIREIELRQLLSRRRVSTLLDSGFRESLNQLIHSYVQRQNNTSDDWEMDEELSSPYSNNQNQNQDQDHNNEETHNHYERIGNEWEVINEMRIDMARLHQRMDNMQRMLEACMEMQSELQRSVRQEVSAALNRQHIHPYDGDNHLPMDDIKLEQVKNGICCMCSQKNIDSLLYRCGHMSTCSKCAEKLVQGGKCPMCRAPVTEVIRAYFIQ